MIYQGEFTLSSELLEQIAAQGFDVLPELIWIVINADMQAERQQYLRAAPYQHTPDRQGHANCSKPKTIKTRLGELKLDVAQVREGGFYPEALEKGQRSYSPSGVARGRAGAHPDVDRDVRPRRFLPQSDRHRRAIVRRQCLVAVAVVGAEEK
ncbi:MAG TPA: transposase [Anaerolineales bacterium]